MSGVQRNIAVLSHDNSIKQQSHMGTTSYQRREDEPPELASGYCIDVNADNASIQSASLFPGLPTPLQIPSPDSSLLQPYTDYTSGEKYWFSMNQSSLSLLDSSHRVISFFLPIVELLELDVRACSTQIKDSIAYLKKQNPSTLSISALHVSSENNMITLGIQEIMFVFSFHSCKIPDRMKHAEAVPTLSCCKGYITTTTPPLVLPSVTSIFQFMEGKPQSSVVYNTDDIHSSISLKVLQLQAGVIVQPPLLYKCILGPVVGILSFQAAVSANERLDMENSVIGTGTVIVAITPIAFVAYLHGKQQLQCQWTSPSLLAPVSAYIGEDTDEVVRKYYPLNLTTELSLGAVWASLVVQESNVLLLHAMPHRFVYSFHRSYTAVLAACASVQSFSGPINSVNFSTHSNILEENVLVLLQSGQIRIFSTAPARLRFGNSLADNNTSSVLPMYNFPLIVAGKEDFLTSAAIHTHLSQVANTRLDMNISYNVPWNQSLEIRASKSAQDTVKTLQINAAANIATLFSPEIQKPKYMYATPLATADTSLPSNSIAAGLCAEFLDDSITPEEAVVYAHAVSHLFDPEPEPLLIHMKQRYVSASFVETERCYQKSLLTWHEATKLLDTHVAITPHSMESVLRKFLAQNGLSQDMTKGKIAAIKNVLKLITSPLQYLHRVGTLHGHHTYTVLSPQDIPTVQDTNPLGLYVSKHTSLLLRNTSGNSVSQLLAVSTGHPITKDATHSDSIHIPLDILYTKLRTEQAPIIHFTTCDTFGSCSLHEVRELDPMRSQASSNSLFHLNQTPALSVPGKLYAVRTVENTLVLTLHTIEGSLLKYIVHHDHSSRGTIEGLPHASVGGVCARGKRLLLPRTKMSMTITSPYMFILSRLANLIPVIINNSLIEYPTCSTSHESASLLLRVLPTQITLYNNSSSCSTDRPGNLSLHSKIQPLFIEEELTRRFILLEMFHIISADPRDYRQCSGDAFIHQICDYTNSNTRNQASILNADPVKRAVLYSLAKSIVSVHSIPMYKYAMLAPSSSAGTITIHATGSIMYTDADWEVKECTDDVEMIVEEEEECAKQLNPALRPRHAFSHPQVCPVKNQLRNVRCVTVVDTYVLHAGALRNQNLGEHKWCLTNRVVAPTVNAELLLDKLCPPTPNFYQCKSLQELIHMTQPSAFQVYRGNLSPLDQAATPNIETFNHAKKVTYGDFADASGLPEPINTWNAVVVSFSSVSMVISLSALHNEESTDCGYQAWPFQITQNNELELYPWCQNFKKYSKLTDGLKSVKLSAQEPLHRVYHAGLVRLDILNTKATTLIEGTPQHAHMLAPVESVDEAICQSSGVLVGFVTNNNEVHLAEIPIIGLPYVEDDAVVDMTEYSVHQPDINHFTLLKFQDKEILSIQVISLFLICLVYTSGECVVFSGPNGLYNEEMSIDLASLLRKQYEMPKDFPVSNASLSAWPRSLELGDGVIRLAVPSADPGFLDVYSPNPEKHTLTSTCWGNDMVDGHNTWSVIAHARVCSYGLSIAAACIINPVFIAITITPSKSYANGLSVLTPAPSAIKLIPFNSIFEHVHRETNDEELRQTHTLPSLPPYHPTSLISDLKASHLQKYTNTLAHLHYAVCASKGQLHKSRVHASVYTKEKFPSDTEAACSNNIQKNISAMNLCLPSQSLVSSPVGNILLPDVDDVKQIFRLEMLLDKENQEKKRLEVMQQQQAQQHAQKLQKQQGIATSVKPAKVKSMLDSDSDSDDNTGTFFDPRAAPTQAAAPKNMLDSDSDTDNGFGFADPRAAAMSPPVKNMLSNDTDSDSDNGFGFADPRAAPVAKPAVMKPTAPITKPMAPPKSMLDDDDTSDSDNGFGFADPRVAAPPQVKKPVKSMLDNSDSDTDDNNSSTGFNFVDPRATGQSKSASKPEPPVQAVPVVLPTWESFYPADAHMQIEDKARLTTKPLPVVSYIPILKFTKVHILELTILLSGYNLPPLPVDYASHCTGDTIYVDEELALAMEECMADLTPKYALLPFLSYTTQKELISMLLSNLHIVDTPVATFDSTTLKPINAAAATFAPSGLVSAVNAPLPGLSVGNILDGVGYAHAYKTQEKTVAHETLEHLTMIRPFLNDSTPDVFAAKYMISTAQVEVEFLSSTMADMREQTHNPDIKYIDIDFSKMTVQLWSVANLVVSRTPYVGIHHALCTASMASQCIQHKFTDMTRPKKSIVKFLTSPFDPLLYSIPDNSSAPQPNITDTPSPIDANMLKWSVLRATGIGFVLASPSVTPAYASMHINRIMKAQYTRSRSANDCLLWAMITNQKLEFLNLLKNEPNMSKAYQFFTNNFSLPQWNEKACANAFNSISKGKFYVAAAFFILADKYDEAVRLLVRNETDIQLALVIAKIAGSRGKGITYVSPTDACLNSDDAIIGINTAGILPVRNIHLQNNSPPASTIVDTPKDLIPVSLFEKVIRTEILPNCKNNPWLMFLSFYLLGDVERAMLVLITHTPRSLTGCRMFLDMVSSGGITYRQLLNISGCLLRHMGLASTLPAQRYTPTSRGLDMIVQTLQLVSFWLAFATKRMGVTTLTLDCVAIYDTVGLLVQQYYKAWHELNYMNDIDEWDPTWRGTMGIGGVQYLHNPYNSTRLGVLSRADLISRSSMSMLLTNILFKQASSSTKTVLASFVRKDLQMHPELSANTLSLVQKLLFHKEPVSSDALVHLGLHNAHWNNSCMLLCNNYGTPVHLTAPTLTKGLFAHLAIDSVVLLHASVQSSFSLTATLAEQTYVYLCRRAVPTPTFCPTTSFTSFTNTFVSVANLGVHQLSSFFTQELESLATLLRSNNMQNLLGESALWYSPSCISSVCQTILPIILRQYNNQTTHAFVASALAQSISILNPTADCKVCGDVGLIFNRQVIATIKDANYKCVPPTKLDAHYFHPPNHPQNASMSSVNFIHAFTNTWPKLRSTSANPLCSFLLQPVHPSIRPVALLLFMTAEISIFLNAAANENYAMLTALLTHVTPLPDNNNIQESMTSMGKVDTMHDVFQFLQNYPGVSTAPIPAIVQEVINQEPANAKKHLMNILMVENIKIPALRQILTKPSTEALSKEAQGLAKLFFVHALLRAFVAKFEALYGKDGLLSAKKWFSSSLIAADTVPPVELFNMPCKACNSKTKMVKTTFAAIATTPTLISMRDNTTRLSNFILKSIHYTQSNLVNLIKMKLSRLVSKVTLEKRMFQLPQSSVLRSLYYGSTTTANVTSTSVNVTPAINLMTPTYDLPVSPTSSVTKNVVATAQVDNVDDHVAFLMANLNSSSGQVLFPLSAYKSVSIGDEYPRMQLHMTTVGSLSMLTLLKPLPGSQLNLVQATPSNAHLFSTITLNGTMTGQSYLGSTQNLETLVEDDESAQYRPFPIYSTLEPLVLAAIPNPAAVHLQSSMKIMPQLMELLQSVILSAEGKVYELPLLSYLRSIPTPSNFQDLQNIPFNGFTNFVPTPVESRLGFINGLESYQVNKKKYVQEAYTLLNAVSTALVRALTRKKPTHGNPGLLSLPESALLDGIVAVLQLLPSSPSVDIVGPLHICAPGDKLHTVATAVSKDFVIMATCRGPIEISMTSLLLATEFHHLAENSSIPHKSTLCVNEPVIQVKNQNIYPNHLGNILLDIVHPHTNQALYSPVSEFRQALAQSPPLNLLQLQNTFTQALGKPLFASSLFPSVSFHNPMVPIVCNYMVPTASLTTHVLDNILLRETALCTGQQYLQGAKCILPSVPDVETALGSCLTSAGQKMNVQLQTNLNIAPTAKPVKTASAANTLSNITYASGACLDLLTPYLAGKINHPLYRNVVQRAFESIILAPPVDNSSIPWASCVHLAQTIRTLPSTRVTAHPTLPLYVTVTEDNMILVWHLHCPLPLANLAMNLRNTPLDVAYGFSANMALTSTVQTSHNPYYSYAYCSNPLNPIRYTQSYHTFDVQGVAIESVSFDPSEAYITVMYANGVVAVWKLDTTNTQYNMIITQQNVTSNRWTVKAIPALHIFRAHNVRGRQAVFLSPFLIATAGKSTNGANIAIWDLLKPNTKRCIAAYNLFNGESLGDFSHHYNPMTELYHTKVKHAAAVITLEKAQSQTFQYDSRVTTADAIFLSESETAYNNRVQTNGASSLCFIPELDLLVLGGPGPVYVLSTNSYSLVQMFDPKANSKLQVVESVINAVAESIATSICDLSQHKQSPAFKAFHETSSLVEDALTKSITVKSKFQTLMEHTIPNMHAPSNSNPTSNPSSPRGEHVIPDVEAIVYSSSMQSLILATSEEDVYIMETAVIPLPLLPPASTHVAEYETSIKEEQVTMKKGKVETHVRTSTKLKTNLTCAFGKGFITSVVYKKEQKHKKKEKNPDRMHIAVGAQNDGDLITIVYPDCAVIAQKHKVPTI